MRNKNNDKYKNKHYKFYKNEYTLSGSIEDTLNLLKNKYDITFNTNNKEAIIEWLRLECGWFISDEQEKEFFDSNFPIN